MRANIVRLWRGLDDDTRLLARHVLRYGVAGVGVTLFQIGVYNLLAGPAEMRPLLANLVGYVLAVCVGYVVHSRFTFEGHGDRDNIARTGGRFVAASLTGFAANSLWVWLFTARLHWPDWTPSLPMFFVTPGLLFLLNRYWVFE